MRDDLIYFETFTEGWRLAQLTNPYLHNGLQLPVPPGSAAAAAIVREIELRSKRRNDLWDGGEGDYVYGLS